MPNNTDVDFLDRPLEEAELKNMTLTIHYEELGLQQALKQLLAKE